MNSCRAWYACWQMQCCGDPFKIGDVVKWLVCEPHGEIRAVVDLGHLDYWYEAHDTEIQLFYFTGTVTSIKGLFEQYIQSEDDPRFWFPTKGELIDITSADGWEEPKGDLEIIGYIVELENCSIEPMKKKSPSQ